nr:hypothetical protein [uncultured Undibacterium sp.]
MKITLFSKLFVLIMTLVLSNSVKSNDNVFSEHLRNCNLTNGKNQCWKSAEEYLQALPTPTNEKDFSGKFENYYLLAKTAHFAGDFSDANRFFHIVEEFNRTRSKYEKLKDMDLTPMIKYDHAMLYLSAHSYQLALDMFENAENAASRMVGYTGYKGYKFELSIGKVAALIGLSRWLDVEAILEELTDSLNFKEVAPWEAWPFGPQLIGPYSTGRRIVAAYVRLKQYDRALALIDKIEYKRAQVMAEFSATNHQALQLKPWAALCNRDDLLNDKSEIFIHQGRLKQAEEILKSLSQADSKNQSDIKKRTFLKFAEIEARRGHKKKQQKFLVEANKLDLKDREKLLDPLSETFGYLQ